MRSYHGLTLTTPAGASWRWVGSTTVHRRGEDVRIERWQARCPACGQTVTVRARLASGLRQYFYSRRFNVPPSEVIEVRVPLPDKQFFRAFDLRNCDDHRRPAKGCREKTRDTLGKSKPHALPVEA